MNRRSYELALITLSDQLSALLKSTTEQNRDDEEDKFLTEICYRISSRTKEQMKKEGPTHAN